MHFIYCRCTGWPYPITDTTINIITITNNANTIAPAAPPVMTSTSNT